MEEPITVSHSVPQVCGLLSEIVGKRKEVEVPIIAS